MRSKKRAVVRVPADTLWKALRMKKNLGEVDVAKANDQHIAYCDALCNLGFNLMVLPPVKKYPDGVFVEDPAVIIKDILIITSLRRKERRGEEKLLYKKLAPFFPKPNVFNINPPAFIEGGDVLVADKMLFIGLSKRTNEKGADELARIAHDYCGYDSRIFKIPEHWLHLRGGVSFHAARNIQIIAVSEEICSYFFDLDYNFVVTPAEERFGANGISNNGKIIIHAGKPKTKKILRAAGFEVRELEMSEFEKIDGALSCLSKIF
ncbi:MAG: Dimethylargininase [Candidatus Azambacteria bacterium GW2011_GWB1_42_17]|uniref:Dimethylargininase n=1 Tax=Candidatus Azambacteria bacterium GW2011_GWB1_42_17 TaxID=1618615 RepID=A0A0G0Z4I4_9BACT|nr:MAG: Dimethylargininase [Candidatus Azambacteria bacterium GW2011_GWB1_42_17]